MLDSCSLQCTFYLLFPSRWYSPYVINRAIRSQNSLFYIIVSGKSEVCYTSISQYNRDVHTVQLWPCHRLWLHYFFSFRLYITQVNLLLQYNFCNPREINHSLEFNFVNFASFKILPAYYVSTDWSQLKNSEMKNTPANHPALPDFTLTLILHCWRISQKLSHIPGRVRAQFYNAEEGVWWIGLLIYMWVHV